MCVDSCVINKITVKYHFSILRLVNKSLGNLLRCLVGEKITGMRSFVIYAEFTYNSSVNRVIRMSPFEIVHGYRPRQPVDLIPMAHHHILEYLIQPHYLHCIFINSIKKLALKFKKIMQTMKLMHICTKRPENLT